MAVRRPRPGPGLDGPAGDQDGHDERGHHPVEPGGERPAAPEVEVAAPEGHGLDGADGQGGQGPEGDERVHAGRPVAEQPGAVPEERPAAGDLDGDGQDQDGPAGRRRLRRRQRHHQQRPGPEATR